MIDFVVYTRGCMGYWNMCLVTLLSVDYGRCASGVGRFVCPSLLVFNRSTVRNMFMRAFMSRTGVYLTVSWVLVPASV